MGKTPRAAVVAGESGGAVVGCGLLGGMLGGGAEGVILRELVAVASEISVVVVGG